MTDLATSDPTYRYKMGSNISGGYLDKNAVVVGECYYSVVNAMVNWNDMFRELNFGPHRCRLQFLLQAFL